MGTTLVIGPSGAGKTYLAKWANVQGIEAYDADRIEGLASWFDGKGRPVSFPENAGKEFLDNHEFLWRKEVLKLWLRAHPSAIVFGLSGNAFELAYIFDSVYFLKAEPKLLLQRLQTSTERPNPMGKTHYQQKRVLRYARLIEMWARDKNIPFIDASLPPEEIFQRLGINIQGKRYNSEFPEVDALLAEVVNTLPTILGDNLVGIYLTGSLAYNDYKPGSSDVDLVVVTKHRFSEKIIQEIKEFHSQLERKKPTFQKRIECSYVPLHLLQETLPPKEPRPYVGEGIFYTEALYGNEWLINNYWLSRCGVTLVGTGFNTLVKPIQVQTIKQACRQDLKTEWLPKLNTDYLDNPHYQAYFVLNLCRIAYTVMNNDFASKTQSANWVKQTFPQWRNLIDEAMNWEYGKEMKRQEEAKALAGFINSLTDLNST